MSNRIAIVSLALLVILGVFSTNITVASAQLSSVSTSPRQSAVNEVPEFHAEGEGNGFSLKMSPTGGSLSTSSSSMALMPWGYVTTKWTTGTVYIIFLANVTQTDFHIAFLYLTNSSDQFALRIFEYQGGSLNPIIFDGTHYVNSRMTKTNSVAMPSIRLQVKAQTDSTLSAIGPELYVDHNYGAMINGTSMLKITAIQNQLFQGPNDYNELWSLLSDDFGNYYFAILYMQNSDPNHVILEHQVRLNDYQTSPGRTFNAQWVGGSFESYLKVRLPKSSSIVRVNGFPFQTNNMGTVSIYVPRGLITVEVPNEIASTSDVRWHFTSWDSYGTQNPLNITADSFVDIKANYQAEYLLTLDNDYGKAKGAGWYAQGSNATFNVPTLVDSNNGTRRVFLQFSGDYNSTSNTGWVVMNSPKHVSATWKTQFNVKLQLCGVPANSKVTLTLNGKPQLINGSKTTELWVDNGEELTIKVQTTQIQGTNVNYNYNELQVDGQTTSSNVVITKPVFITIVFSEQQKAPSTIDLKVTPASSISGYPVALTGSVSGSDGGSSVTLSYSTDKLNWEQLANVSTARSGSFVYSWTPNGSGTYFIRAFWPGDERHAPASKMVSVEVQNAMPGNLSSLGGLQDVVQGFMKQLNAMPFAALPLELARSLLVLGIVSADLLIPSAPPVLGYFIGSLLVGFVFVFPISAILLSIKAARSHRSPKVVWLTPLVTIWVVALFLLTTNGALFAIPQELLAASVILLISSNMLMIPLVFSLLLARVIHG